MGDCDDLEIDRFKRNNELSNSIDTRDVANRSASTLGSFADWTSESGSNVVEVCSDRGRVGYTATKRGKNVSDVFLR